MTDGERRCQSSFRPGASALSHGTAVLRRSRPEAAIPAHHETNLWVAAASVSGTGLHADATAVLRNELPGLLRGLEVPSWGVPAALLNENCMEAAAGATGASARGAWTPSGNHAAPDCGGRGRRCFAHHRQRPHRRCGAGSCRPRQSGRLYKDHCRAVAIATRSRLPSLDAVGVSARAADAGAAQISVLRPTMA
jgi:hypothetical protein